VLLFPIMWFAFGAWDGWLSYRRNRDALDRQGAAG
jgi:hypothetical protein